MSNRHIIISLFLLFLFKISVAQPDSLKVYDLVVLLDDDIDTLTIDSLQHMDTIAYVTVLFKLNHPDSTAKVYIKLGNAKDVGNLRSDDYNVIFFNGDYCVQMDTSCSKIWGETCHCQYMIYKKEIQYLKWATVYAEDLNGVLTTRKYFKCQ